MEAITKAKTKVIIPVVLCVGLLGSIGVNAWLYSQLSSIKQSTKDIQLRHVSELSEYEAITLEIKDGIKRLADQGK